MMTHKGTPMEKTTAINLLELHYSERIRILKLARAHLQKQVAGERYLQSFAQQNTTTSGNQ